MFGINGPEFIVVLIVGVVVLGPSRVAQALVWLQHAIVKLRQWSADMREYTAEMRTIEKDATNQTQHALAELNPAQLDPRNMIRQAVAEEMQLWLKQTESHQTTPTSPSKEKSHDS